MDRLSLERCGACVEQTYVHGTTITTVAAAANAAGAVYATRGRLEARHYEVLGLYRCGRGA